MYFLTKKYFKKQPLSYLRARACIYKIQWCVSINHFVVEVCDRNKLSSVDCKNLQNCASLTYEVTNANLIYSSQFLFKSI
jgi:hypothetical protein